MIRRLQTCAKRAAVLVQGAQEQAAAAVAPGPAVKSYAIRQPPQLLTLHLKRFEQVHTSEGSLVQLASSWHQCDGHLVHSRLGVQLADCQWRGSRSQCVTQSATDISHNRFPAAWRVAFTA
jgi:hypothetical protein